MDTNAATLPELIDWSVDRYANTLALADGETRLTYAQLGRLVDQAARAMVEHGIETGDAVSVWAPNRWEWVVVALAVSRVGAVLVPVNTRFKGAEAAYVLKAAKVRMLFVANGFLDTDYEASLDGQDTPNLKHVIDMASNFDDFMARGDSPVHQPELDRRSAAVEVDDINVIMFTSGTTGLPKGVQIRGSAIIRAFDRCATEFGVGQGDPYLQVNPYFHAFGYNCGLIVSLLKGATNVPVATFEPSAVLALIQRERIAIFPGPPAIFQSLLNQPDLDSYDLSSLAGCLTGAATIPVEMVVAMKERLGFTTIITAYGMTETSGLAAYCRADDPAKTIATTSGRAGPDMELAIVDDDLNEVPRGTAGELLVRGFQVTPGYLDAPQKTAETITSEGWLKTGDIAVMDNQGYIDITDRKKDMFIMGGFNAYPAEIERMMLEHPEIGLVAVIGVPDDRMGEVGAAYVIPTHGTSPTEGEIIAWCRQQMANYKVPRFVRFVDELPLTASGKVQKTELRAAWPH